MGGGSSRPAPPPRREEEDTRPTADSTSGISLSQAQKCARCDLRIGANASTSIVTLRRSVDDPEKPPPAGERFAASKKMFITPDKPFQMSFNGTSFAVTQMAIYRPSPIRIDNVQADAVLSLNDFSDPEATHVILIPIASGVTYGAAGDFIGRIMQNVNAFTTNETTKQFNPLTVPVGNDWSLTNVLPTGRGQDNNEVSIGYFQWNAGELERYARIDTPSLIRWGWRQKPGGVTTIMTYEPVRVSYATSSYISTLPYAPSSESAPAPGAGYVFRQGACLTCSDKPSVDPAKLEAMREDAKNAFLNPVSVVAALVGIIVGAATLIASYYALSWVLDGGGKFLVDGTMGFSKWFVGVLRGEAQQQV